MEILIVLLIVYLVSPIPLLFIAIGQTKRANRLSEELNLFKQAKRIKQPDTQTGVPVVSVSEEASDLVSPAGTTPHEGTELNPEIPAVAPVPVAVVPIKIPSATEQVAEVPADDSSSEPDKETPGSLLDFPLSKPGALLFGAEKTTARINREAAQPGRPQTGRPNLADPRPHVTVPHIIAAGGQPEEESNNTVPLLVIGVALFFLASIGFISATWSTLSDTARALCLLSFSFVLLAAGIIAKCKLNLPNTSLAFYSIGCAALPVTILGSAAFRLLGNTFTLTSADACCNTFLLALSCLLVLLLFGSVFFESSVFAAGTLGTASLILLTACIRLEQFYPANLILIVLFASAVIFLAPKASEIPSYSSFYPYASVFTVYAICNLYVMSCAALSLSDKSPYTGIFLIILAAVFLHPVLLEKSDGLCSLPSVALFLIGTGLLFHPSGLLRCILFMETAAVCLIALSYWLKRCPLLKTVSFYIGLAFLLAAPFPLAYYSLCDFTDHPGPLALTIPIIAGLLFLTKDRNQSLYAAGAVIPVFTLLYGLSLHLVSLFADGTDAASGDIFPALPRDAVFLTALIVSGALYFLYHLLPLGLLYSETGAGILLVLFSLSGFLFTETFPEGSSVFAAKNAFAFGFMLLALYACLSRRFLTASDRRTDSADNPMPLSCAYACIWPLYYVAAFLTWGSVSDASRGGSLIAFILCCFGVLSFLLLKEKCEDGMLRFGADGEGHALPRRICFGAAAFSMLFALGGLCGSMTFSRDSSPVLFILQHLLPFLIPAVLLFAYLRFGKNSGRTSVALLLCSLYSATALLFYAVEIFREFRLSESLPVPEVCFSAEFLLSLLLVPLVLYYMLRSDGIPEKAGFIWTVTAAFLLFVLRFASPDLTENVIYSVSVGMALLLLACVFLRKSLPAALLVLTAFSVHYISFMYTLCTANEVPLWSMVLLLQIPVILFAATRLRAFMLLFQCVVFFAVPILTEYLPDAVSETERIADRYNVIARLFHTLFFYITDSHYLMLTLPGFAVIGIFYLLTEKDTVIRSRILALSCVAVSTLPCLRIPGANSLADSFGQLFLVPCAVFLILLPKIIPEQPVREDSGRALTQSIRFVCAVSGMALLGITALAEQSLRNLLCYGIVSFIVLLLSYLFSHKAYLRLGILCMVALLVYLINRIWGDMAWWIYLFITGATLVYIAVRNEIRKRS